MSFVGSPEEKQVFELIRQFGVNIKIAKTDNVKGIVYFDVQDLELYRSSDVGFDAIKHLFAHIKINSVSNELFISNSNSSVAFLKESFWIPSKTCTDFIIENDKGGTDQIVNSALQKYLKSGKVSTNKFKLTGLQTGWDVKSGEAKRLDIKNCELGKVTIDEGIEWSMIENSSMKLCLNATKMSMLSCVGEDINIDFENNSKLINCDTLHLKQIAINSFRNFPAKAVRIELSRLSGKFHHILNLLEPWQNSKPGSLIVSSPDNSDALHVFRTTPDLRTISVYDLASRLLEYNFDEDVISL